MPGIKLAPIVYLSRQLDDPAAGIEDAQNLLKAVNRCIEDEVAQINYEEYLAEVEAAFEEERRGYMVEPFFHPDRVNLDRLIQLRELIQWFITP